MDRGLIGGGGGGFGGGNGGGGDGFFLDCEDLGRMSNHSPPALFFFQSGD